MDNDWSNNGGSFSVSIQRDSRNVTLVVQRNMSCVGATLGTLSINGVVVARTLELPWRNDQKYISRIQRGTYLGKVRTDHSPGHVDLGWRIELLNVPNHEQIELHIGRYPRNTEGCILVGTEVAHAVERNPARGARSAGVSGDVMCSLTDPAGAIAKIQAALERASSNGVSSQILNITLEVRD
jgi:hypothetical protein